MKTSEGLVRWTSEDFVRLTAETMERIKEKAKSEVAKGGGKIIYEDTESLLTEWTDGFFPHRESEHG